MTVPFTARRRAEIDASTGSPARSTARPGARRAGTERYADLLAVVAELRAVPPGPAAPRVHRLPARAADGRGRDRAGRRHRPGRAEEARLVLPVRPAAPRPRLPTLLGGAALSGPPRRWPSPPRPRCPATPSTPSSAASRTPAPAWPRSGRRQGPQLLDQRPRPPRRGRPAGPRLRRPGAPRSPRHPRRLRRPGHRGGGPAAGGYADDRRRETIRALRTFTDESLDGLGALARTVPSPPATRCGRGDRPAQIDARAATACPACGGARPRCRRSCRR